MKKLIAIVWLIRVPIVSVSVLLLVDAFIIGVGTVHLFGVLATATMLFAGYIINDIMDIKSDMVSSPDRPLPSGVISLREAKQLWSCCIFASSVCAFATRNIGFILFLCFYEAMFWIYTKYLKKHWLVKNGVTALFFSSITLIPSFFSITAIPSLYSLFLFSFLFTFGREMMMDVKDTAGDGLIDNSKRLPQGLSFFTALLIVISSFLLCEAVYLQFQLDRYALVLLCCLAFAVVARKRKKIWILCEEFKIVYFLELFTVLLRLIP